MPRPRMRRRIRGIPNSNYFKPAGIPLRELQEITIALEEFEALRLIDLQELSQEQAATKMGVSQSTLSRTLASARKKVSQALVLGQAINIQNKTDE